MTLLQRLTGPTEKKRQFDQIWLSVLSLDSLEMCPTCPRRSAWPLEELNQGFSWLSTCLPLVWYSSAGHPVFKPDTFKLQASIDRRLFFLSFRAEVQKVPCQCKTEGNALTGHQAHTDAMKWVRILYGLTSSNPILYFCSLNPILRRFFA